MKKLKLMFGDNMELLKSIPDNSIDSIVTDPPYGLSFMNKRWDYNVPSVDFWKEILRVLKPGGHVLSFGGTRTYHRMVVNMEDAGFEIRDQIMWIYGSGFPKSLNIGKAVDKLQDIKDNSPYEGLGTALKPANEPICMARKPLSEKSIVENVLKWKTGGLNIDDCRIGNEENGRFPSNIIFECICDEVIKGEKGNRKPRPKVNDHNENSIFGIGGVGIENYDYNDTGDIHTNPECPCNILNKQSDGASRFFYNAKVSKKERNLGLDETFKNTHPTLKPIKLMAYLCRLITPPGGIVMDPFMGSGSTGISALIEGFKFVGMEMDEEYFKIAEARIQNYEEYRKLIK